MYTATTNDIRISVETQYQAALSKPRFGQFLFAYRVTIENNSPYAVQLLRRHWYIKDTTGEMREVEGEGVVGMQPLLQPGERHQYVSGAQISSEIGTMHGFFTMQRQVDNAEFEAVIPQFSLEASMKKN
jgi:ApaG protein